MTSMQALSQPALAAEPWRRRLVRTLLYGRNVDRGAKAKARVGLAIVAFAAVFAVIAGRLVMFAVAPESRVGLAAIPMMTCAPSFASRYGSGRCQRSSQIRTPILPKAVSNAAARFPALK